MRKEESRVGFMTPPEKKSTTESIALFKQTLEGNNYSPQSIKAYMGDLGQFVEWLKTRRVDFDIPWLFRSMRSACVHAAFSSIPCESAVSSRASQSTKRQ